MAKNNIRLPQSTAGLTNFSDADTSRFHLKPGQVVAFIVLMVILVLILKAFGPVWFNMV